MPDKSLDKLLEIITNAFKDNAPILKNTFSKFNPKQIIEFYPVISLDRLKPLLHSHFLFQLSKACQLPPVCFEPGDIGIEGNDPKFIKLPNGEFVKRYFRCDALAEAWSGSDIPAELRRNLSRYLNNIAI